MNKEQLAKNYADQLEYPNVSLIRTRCLIHFQAGYDYGYAAREEQVLMKALAEERERYAKLVAAAAEVLHDWDIGILNGDGMMPVEDMSDLRTALTQLT